jgi:hypothetical protein
MTDFDDIKTEVLNRLDMQQVASMCGVVMKKAGAGLWVSCCPFHAEKSGSFNIGGKKGFEHRAHCFGCGWSGDIFAFWQAVKGCDFKQALKDLAGVAGVPMGADGGWTRSEVPRVRAQEKRLEVEDDAHRMPSLPSLRHLRRGECEEIARHRGLDAEAVWLAARRFGRLAFSMWPLYERAGEWMPRTCGALPSWCAIDSTRKVAEFRRLDNEKYVRQDGGTIKSWSTCGKNWPLGAADMNGRPAVMLVEGGPDMLAAYHFLMLHGQLDRVAVVCMLGAGNRIRAEALPFFAGKRVRIMVDADALKDDENLAKRRVPGMEAAARWSVQLCEAGAAVETFCVGPIYDTMSIAAWGRGELTSDEVQVLHAGLTLPSGAAVKDLNDLARCAPSVLESADVREAFRSWDF